METSGRCAEEINAALTDLPLPQSLEARPSARIPGSNAGETTGRNPDGYCRELESSVAALTDEAAGDACLAHTNAFNFGRSIARMESAGY